MARNFLQYSGLTYEEIIQQVNDKLNSDERFANFRESAIAQTLVEIFAGTVDIVNYYLERRAEESFFDTARLRSSVIMLARQLGYVVQRPVPAEASIKLKLKGNFAGIVNANDQLQIPFQSVFSFGGFKYILKNTLTISLSPYVDRMNAQGNAFESDFIELDIEGNDIEIVQGEIKEKVFEGSTNPQVGSTFQLYRIDDTEASNRYGSEDYTVPVTKVWVGNVKNDNTEYTIDRRSLINWEVIDAATGGETVDVCVLRTSITEGLELLFGDGRFAELGATTSGQGAQTSFENVYLQYLATKGSLANQTGVKGKKLTFSGKVFTNTGQDITDKVEFNFKSNITGGADMEDIDSIRINAPNIYYTLDRLVSKVDYTNYLRSLTSPIDIKNAIAWGEQEELEKRNTDALIRMFNIVFFSVVGPLYQVNTSPYFAKSRETGLDDAVLDFRFDEDELNQRNYFIVYTKGSSDSICDSGNMVEQLREYQTTSYVWKMAGTDVATSAQNGDYWSTNYGQNTSIDLWYTTDATINGPTLSGFTQITMDTRELSGIANNDTAMTELASLTQAQLRGVTDSRGTGLTNNANYGSPAFPNSTVAWNSVSKEFTISFEADTPCYATTLSGAVAIDMGLSVSSPDLVTVDRELSNKIVTVVNNLNTRSQTTIRNIYLSPIIQSFDLKGTVYLNALFDKNAERTNIENAIYTWLNDNADFNEEIFLSNIVEKIEQFPSVINANVRLVPNAPVNPEGGLWYKSGNNRNVEIAFSDATEKAQAYTYIDSAISSFLFGSQVTTDTSGAAEFYQSYGAFIIQTYNLAFRVRINERDFLETFAKSLYLTLRGEGGNFANFADSDNFIGVISDIHKDFATVIKYNIMDTAGNIAREEDSRGNFIKGGFSLGNEIAKINSVMTYEYKG